MNTAPGLWRSTLNAVDTIQRTLDGVQLPNGVTPALVLSFPAVNLEVVHSGDGFDFWHTAPERHPVGDMQSIGVDEAVSFIETWFDVGFLLGTGVLP